MDANRPPLILGPVIQSTDKEPLMSQYCVRMTAEFPSSDAAEKFVHEAEKLIGFNPTQDGKSVVMVLNGQRVGKELRHKAKDLGGEIVVEVVGDEF